MMNNDLPDEAAVAGARLAKQARRRARWITETCATRSRR